MELRYQHNQSKIAAARLLEEAFADSTKKHSTVIKGEPTATWSEDKRELEVTIDSYFGCGVDATIRFEQGGTLYLTATSRGPLRFLRRIGKTIGIGNKPAEDIIFDKLNRVFDQQETYKPIFEPAYAANPTPY